MSRDYIACAICESEFQVDHDDDPIDVCPRCTNRISRIADRALSSERHRIRTLLLEVAAKFGGPVGKALEEVAGRWGQ